MKFIVQRSDPYADKKRKSKNKKILWTTYLEGLLVQRMIHVARNWQKKGEEEDQGNLFHISITSLPQTERSTKKPIYLTSRRRQEGSAICLLLHLR